MKNLNGLHITNITSVTFPGSLLISDNQQETIVFHISWTPPAGLVSHGRTPGASPCSPRISRPEGCVQQAKATCVQSHRPFDMTIKFLSGALPPKCCLYSLSAPETEVMDTDMSRRLPASSALLLLLLLVLGFSLWETRTKCCNLTQTTGDHHGKEPPSSSSDVYCFRATAGS